MYLLSSHSFLLALRRLGDAGRMLSTSAREQHVYTVCRCMVMASNSGNDKNNSDYEDSLRALIVPDLAIVWGTFSAISSLSTLLSSSERANHRPQLNLETRGKEYMQA